MPTQCAVFGCCNTSHKTSGADVKVSYHSFPRPKDLASSLLREEWICRCRRGKKTFNPNTSRICSAHFREDDYERDLKNELLGLPLKRILKKDAIPTLALSYSTPEEQSITLNENIEVITLDVIDDTKTIPEQIIEELNHDIAPIPTRNPIEEYQNGNYKVKYEELLEKYESLKSASTTKIRALNSQLIYFKKKAYNIKKPSKSEETASTLLRMLLTKNQINLLSKKKKRVNWNSEEIAMAFTLRHYSRKCYLYLRNVLHYPLPTLSSLKKWALKIDIIQSDETDIQGESHDDRQASPSILAEP